MADVVRWIDAANLSAAIASHAASVAAIKDSKEPTLIRQLAVQLIKLLINNGSAVGPVEIPRYKTFVEMIYLQFRAIGGNLCAMAAIEQNALVFIFRSIKQPVEPFHNGVVSCALIQKDP